MPEPTLPGQPDRPLPKPEDITGGGVTRTVEPPIYQQKREEQLKAEGARRLAEQRRDLQRQFPNAKLPGVVALPEPEPEPPPAGSISTEPTAQPVAGQGPNHAAMINEAKAALLQGMDPKEVADQLDMKGVPRELWPLDIQNAVLGFAAGGAVPDEEEAAIRPMSGRAEEAGYTTSATGQASSAVHPAERDTPAHAAEVRRRTPDVPPQGAEQPEPQRANVRVKPQLVSDVRIALDGGVKFLQRHFNIGNEGAVPTPEDEATTETGAQRFAKGEGAATHEEVNDIDDQVDPTRELDEGKRQMARLAKTMRWYQSRGRKEEAEAAAASLMQYGAAKFSRLGSLAQVAYQNGDIDKTVQYLEKAYEMIPDGAEVDVRVNETTGKIEAIHTDDEGDEEFVEISPEELPGLFKSVQDKSSYWSAVFRIADPEGAKSKDIEERTIRTEQRAGERELKKEGRTDIREQEKEARADVREQEKEARAAAAKVEEEKRALVTKKGEEERAAIRDRNKQLLGEALTRSREKAPPAGEKDMAKIGPMLAEAAAAKAAFAADDSEENALARDYAYSKLYKEVGGDDQWMLNNGYAPDEFQFRLPEEAEANVATATAPPTEYPNAKKMKDPTTGQPIWAVPDENSPSGWSKVE